MNRKVTYTVEITFREMDVDIEQPIIIDDELLNYTSTLMIDMLEFSDNITARIEHMAITSNVTKKTYHQGQPYNLKSLK